ncbi:hypothetical protein GCM10022254_09470 [Actinomadura meridiana]|uniref:DUF222 domain-containing protein n=1 Tax=Actinomadura meridiana TaxID=559626 RepID=A0ABP8BTP1_9ACTN
MPDRTPTGDLREALDRETKAASAAMDAGELSTCALHTARAVGLQKQIDDRLGRSPDTPTGDLRERLTAALDADPHFSSGEVVDTVMRILGEQPGDLRTRLADTLRTTFHWWITAEWICCDPPEKGHKLCERGHAARRMVASLLADDPERHPPTSPILDAVLPVVQAWAAENLQRPVGSRPAGGRESARGSEIPGDLRERLAEALYRWTMDQAAGGPARLLTREETVLWENSLARADAVLPVVEAVLTEQATRKDLFRVRASCCEDGDRTYGEMERRLTERAEEAEAAVQRVRDLADSLMAPGAPFFFPEAGHRILAALDQLKETPPDPDRPGIERHSSPQFSDKNRTINDSPHKPK